MPARRAWPGLRELLARDPGITAVLCSTDQIALGVMAAAADAGRRRTSRSSASTTSRRGGRPAVSRPCASRCWRRA